MGIFFGTDGIRGIVNQDLNNNLCFNCGNALAQSTKNAKILVGTDTRISSSLVATAFTLGAISGGANVTNVGICPTAGICYLAKSLEYDYGVTITASHNPAEFNGIKIFNSLGYKLEDKAEENLERKFVYNKIEEACKVGQLEYNLKLTSNYLAHLINSINFDLSGLTIVIDASNGAGYHFAPKAFSLLGAKIIKINCKNDGKNINNNCGSLYPSLLTKKVKQYKADFGIALDGDADRVIAVDNNGDIVDGDILIFIFAKYLNSIGKLKSSCVVGTRHTNMGIEKELNANKINLIRTDIGDKYVIKELVDNQLSLGGEQSGHIILADYETTGDGILSGLMLAKIIKESNQPLSELKKVKLYPQCNINCLVHDKMKIINSAQLSEAIKNEEYQLGNSARVMVRVSGTEPKIRIMVEALSEELAKNSATRLAETINKIDVEN